MSKVRFRLEPAASEEANVTSEERQVAIRAVLEALRDGGLNPSPSVFVQDSVAGGARLLGEFLLENSAAIRDWVAIILAPLGVYLAARPGRKVRMTIGDREFEATSVKEIERLLALAEDKRSGDPGAEDAAGRE